MLQRMTIFSLKVNRFWIYDFGFWIVQKVYLIINSAKLLADIVFNIVMNLGDFTVVKLKSGS
jgi:predicted Co/Zn/Cd cation transporter (cation efflux family)